MVDFDDFDDASTLYGTRPNQRAMRFLSTSSGAVTFAALLVLASFTSTARAEGPQAFELEWESPIPCPQKREVDEQVRELLGVAPGSELPSHLQAKGVIEPVGERFQLSLSVRVAQTRGTRVIVSNECGSLGKAAAVVLGLLIRKERDLGRELSSGDLGNDFQSQQGQHETNSNHPRTTEPQSAAPLRSVEPGLELQDESPRHNFLLLRGPSLVLDPFTLPDLNIGFGFAAGIRHFDWRLFATATLWLSEERTGREAYRAQFARSSAELWGCRGWRWSHFEVAPCLLAAVDFISVHPTSQRLATTDQRVTMYSAGAGATGHLYLAPWLSLFVSATGRVVMNPKSFIVQTVAGPEQTHAIPVGAIQTSLGAEWLF